MASYQRTALYVLFDALEADLVQHIRTAAASGPIPMTSEERARAQDRIAKIDGTSLNVADDGDIIYGLDLGDKYSLLLRMKEAMPSGTANYFARLKNQFDKAIGVRNAVMHGRPLTTIDYAFGFSFANDLVRSTPFWPELCRRYREYTRDPHAFLRQSVSFIDTPGNGEALNNLPIPDYDDTGFVPRPDLEKELKRKILGRHPVVTVLGDGGNGKSALTLQTLYSLLSSNDHSFDAIIWTTAKSTRLTTREIQHIEGAITSSLAIFEQVAEMFEPGDADPLSRVQRLLSDNKILLVIDNLETVLDDNIKAFVEEVPGESKVVFTSRVPLGSDLSVVVAEFSPSESRSYLRRLADAYAVDSLREAPSELFDRYARRLGYKPLLLKWFVMGVASGLDPDRIIANPEVALKFCLENVVDRLSAEARKVAVALTAVARPLSPSAVQHVTGLSALEAEKGISELFRFALVDQEREGAYERLFALRPFAKAYLSRVIGVNSEEAAQFARRNAQIDYLYQEQLSSARLNLYSLKNYVVRSRSEALAANELRRAIGQSVNGDFEEADKIIAALRISTPDYFEVPRVEAFIRREQGDLARAADCYEEAIELDDRQPQLMFFYAGFLMRNGECAKASEWFDRALALEDHSLILREAARNEFMRGDFEKAQGLLDRAWPKAGQVYKHQVVLVDLQAQLFVRRAEQLLNNDDPAGALTNLRRLHEFLTTQDPALFDSLLVHHVLKAWPTVHRLRFHQVFGHETALDQVEALLMNLGDGPPAPAAEPAAREGERYTGRLKKGGRQATFGFLRAANGEEAFVHRSEVADVVWRGLIAGMPASFAVRADAKGRWKASDVVLEVTRPMATSA